ncbi:pentapeptide repeat-containing protein [Modestobacter sp. VKM Ac-2985]|uniref:pentapeptide repeat-containing protein n=1 Tax=Modestobacter sp. VKM Ac-2985 TaxID=3004139 RepID=UPI0022AB7118|nr:pentapeptide repeat-containing protein [Modestobacter sp. VKM Ac-2985]MCZ2839410.1 pentapeptide repeat-containing protein [Modestobacter sp. VKM Ac-2985]
MPDHRPTLPLLAEARRDLTADCSRCNGLCCVAPAFAASADFAIDKPAGTPCPNLQPDSRCGVHDQLRDRGFPGCVVFDCFGAGQRVTQQTRPGRDWRTDAATAAAVFAVFPVMRQLTELLWHLTEAGTLLPAGPLATEVAAAHARAEELTRAPADELTGLDVGGLRREVGELLGQVSDAVRADVPGRARDRRGADLMGADLRGADLHGASLRGAYLIGADLRGADLRRTDLLGTDLRAADLRSADLTGALFLTQPQLTAAGGDAGTSLPESLARPAHWSTSTTAARTDRGRRRPRRR